MVPSPTFSPALQVILSGCVSFGVPLLIALYELRSLRRRGRDDGDRNGGPPAPVPAPTPGGQARPLPACLVPSAQWRAPRPSPVRELA